MILIGLFVLVMSGFGGYFGTRYLLSVNDTPKISSKQTRKPQVPAKPSFNKLEYSSSAPDSLWVIVNKLHPLNPASYIPNDLVTINGATISQKVQVDFEAMMNDATKARINLKLVSSYRSYDSQSAVYNNYVSIYGQTKTDTFSARPGYSEHQTGLSIDFGSYNQATCNLDDCFGQTTEGAWLAANAQKYGFMLRYPAEKQTVTGYKSEPWHYRYVGKKLIDEMKKQNIITLEEFFGISGGETYI